MDRSAGCLNMPGGRLNNSIQKNMYWVTWFEFDYALLGVLEMARCLFRWVIKVEEQRGWFVGWSLVAGIV